MKYILFDEVNSTNTYFKELSKQEFKIVGIDLETEKLDDSKFAGLFPANSKIRLISLYLPEINTGILVDLKKLNYKLPENLREFLESNVFVAHNALFEAMHLKFHFDLSLTVKCSQIMFQIVCVASKGVIAPNNTLAAIVEALFNTTIQKSEQLSNWSINELSKDQMRYALLDSYSTYRIYEKLLPHIEIYKLKNVYSLYCNSINAISNIILNGIEFDTTFHNNLIIEWQEDINNCRQFFDNTYPDVNFNSSKQVSDLLQQLLPSEDIAKLERTEKTGVIKTGAKKIKRLGDSNGLINNLVVYKRYSKLLSTYGESIKKLINPTTKRLHPNFLIGYTVTGRLSSRNPNFQNFPGGNKFKKCFTASSGNILISADYSQIELRVLASYARDYKMQEAFNTKKDLHAMLASNILKKDIATITKEERKVGKVCNFGLAYGGGANMLKLRALEDYNIDMTLNEAQYYKSCFLNLWSSVASWQKAVTSSAKNRLFVTTALGRFIKLNEDNYYTRSLNNIIQGTASEILLSALILLDCESRKQTKDLFKIINTVHDEIVVETNEKNKDIVIDIMLKCMEKAATDICETISTVDLVSINTGDNWHDAK